jgi:hypothetical protein
MKSRVSQIQGPQLPVGKPADRVPLPNIYLMRKAMALGSQLSSASWNASRVRRALVRCLETSMMRP